MYVLYIAYPMTQRDPEELRFRVVASCYGVEEEFFVVLQSVADRAGYDHKTPFEIRLFWHLPDFDLFKRENLRQRLENGKVFKGRNYQRDIKAWIERQVREVARG